MKSVLRQVENRGAASDTPTCIETVSEVPAFKSIDLPDICLQELEIRSGDFVVKATGIEANADAQGSLIAHRIAMTAASVAAYHLEIMKKAGKGFSDGNYESITIHTSDRAIVAHLAEEAAANLSVDGSSPADARRALMRSIALRVDGLRAVSYCND